ncbi:MAG: YfcC family protein [Arenimonas sp.]|nr:YfcC family protein [Arenimonas sp.]MBP7981459.1 YfcC family protein [Arenimonas sp.]
MSTPEPQTPSEGSFKFPGAVTTLVIVTLLVWVAVLFIPAGLYRTDVDGSPIPGTFEPIASPLSPGERFEQLILAPVNGVYGLRSSETERVDTEIVGRIFGQIGVIVFIMSIGAFISVSFATRSLEVAVASLAHRLRDKGWLLITSVMVLFSLLGSTMGFSVETLGFYALFLPLMAALGYDRLVTASMIILGALIGVMASTVNPFSIGVAAGEAGVSIGDGIMLRVVLWVVLTAMSIGWVLRYAAKVRTDPKASLVGWDEPADAAGEDAAANVGQAATSAQLSTMQKWVLVITAAAFGLMIFSVIPWSSVLVGRSAPADYYGAHEVTGAQPLWFELNWWFPELSMLFILASVLVGVVARMGEKETVRLIAAGAADMLGPAMVVLLAGGVSAIMNNTQTMDTILHSVEQLVSDASAGVFTLLTVLLNVPLAMLIPSSSGHGALVMPLLAPLADFAGVSRATTITAWIMGHGLALMLSPTSVVLVGGLAIAKVGYNKYLRFVWPLLLALFVVSTAIISLAATLG